MATDQSLTDAGLERDEGRRDGEVHIDGALRRAAEMEMRRSAQPKAKRQKRGDVGRFNYAATAELRTGMVGFLLTSIMEREKSALQEGVVLLEATLQRVNPPTLTSLEGLSSIKLAARGAVEESAAQLAQEAAGWDWLRTAVAGSAGQGPLRFAVAYKPRGSEAERAAAAALTTAAARGLERGLQPWLSPGQELRVDLKAPDLVLLVDLLPVHGGGKSAIGLALVPGRACSTKPRLAIKNVGKS